MIGPVFVDTNVLIAARDPADPVRQARAREWLAWLWRERLGRTSIQVLSEFHVEVTRKLRSPVPSEESWREVSALFAWRPLPTDEALLKCAYEAERHWRLGWWDAMIVAAAQLQDCALLLSDDLPDHAVFGTVTVRSPFTTDVHETPEVYRVHPPAAHLHRARGRPSRPRAAAG